MRFAAFVLLPLCAQLATAQPEISVGEQPAFTMSISLKQRTIQPGAEVIVDIVLINNSGKELQMMFMRTGPPLYTFKVFDRDGKPAPLTPLGKRGWGGCYTAKDGQRRCNLTASPGSMALAPGGRLHDVFVLSDYVDLTQANAYKVQLERVDLYTKLLVVSNSVDLSVSEKKQ